MEFLKYMKDLEKGSLFNEEFLEKLKENLTKRDVLGIIENELDIVVPDYEKFSIKEILNYVLMEFEKRFKKFDKIRKNRK